MDFRKVIPFIKKHYLVPVCVGGILALLVLARGIYSSAYYDAVHFSFVYPGIENGQYPDGERFMMYDFLDNDVVSDALSEMHKKGWYIDVTLSDVQQNLSVHTYLTNPVQGKVESSIASGKDFSYYSNEYVIGFSQPNHIRLREVGSFFGIFQPDRSREFLNELMRSYIKHFTTNHTDSGQAFMNLTESLNEDHYDYTDITDFYTMKVQACLDYLIEKDAEGKAYVAKSTGLSFKDLVTSYQTLMDTDLHNLRSYVKSSRLSRDMWQLINRYNVITERYTLSRLKKLDEAAINKTAMLEYDHTFTENIIIVSENEENGLYQARPKTGYDTVTQQTLSASTEAASDEENINETTRELGEYLAASENTEEYYRMFTVANQMVEDFSVKYESLREKAVATIDEYLQYVNGNYLKTSADHPGLISVNLLIKTGIMFLAGAFLVLLLIFAGEFAKSYHIRPRTKKGKEEPAVLEE